ncbi:MAG: hypothetical protein IT186_13520 [Acidobacteria bacterium]|nr:hypothetical protein [Acidobacteriota bacterium]
MRAGLACLFLLLLAPPIAAVDRGYAGADLLSYSGVMREHRRVPRAQAQTLVSDSDAALYLSDGGIVLTFSFTPSSAAETISLEEFLGIVETRIEGKRSSEEYLLKFPGNGERQAVTTARLASVPRTSGMRPTPRAGGGFQDDFESGLSNWITNKDLGDAFYPETSGCAARSARSSVDMVRGGAGGSRLDCLADHPASVNTTMVLGRFDTIRSATTASLEVYFQLSTRPGHGVLGVGVQNSANPSQAFYTYFSGNQSSWIRFSADLKKLGGVDWTLLESVQFVLVFSADDQTAAGFGARVDDFAISTQAIQERYQMSVVAEGAGTGSVSSSPSGINCGGSCKAFFDGGQTVTLTATPSAGSAFVGWSGACAGAAPVCRVTLDQDRTAFARFDRAGAIQDLVLSKGRVRVTVDWKSQYSGESGVAYGIPQKDQFGFFYFTDPNNPEVFTKVLDFESGYAICFVSGLSDFEYTVTFTSLGTGERLVFRKEPGKLSGYANNNSLRFARFAGENDTFAMAHGEGPPGISSVPTGFGLLKVGHLQAGDHAGPAADPQQLNLSGGRIAVTIDWRSQYNGTTGRAYAIPQKDEFGFFYFTDRNNPEVFVKVLDFKSGYAILFVGGLTDYEYTATFRNSSGETWVFFKPAGSLDGGASNDKLKF